MLKLRYFFEVKIESYLKGDKNIQTVRKITLQKDFFFIVKENKVSF